MLATQQSWSQRPGPVGRQAQRNGAGERPSVVGASSTACSCRSQTTLARVLHPRSAAPIPRPINGANVGGTARALEEGQNVERASPGSLSSIASRDSHGRATTAAAPAVASPRAADSSRLSSQPSSALPQTFFFLSPSYLFLSATVPASHRLNKSFPGAQPAGQLTGLSLCAPNRGQGRGREARPRASREACPYQQKRQPLHSSFVGSRSGSCRVWLWVAGIGRQCISNTTSDASLACRTTVH